MLKHSLLRTFTIFSLLTFILTGVVLSYFISDHIKRDQYINLEETAQIAADSLSGINLDDTISNSHQMTILDDLKSNLNLYKPQSIILFDNNSDVVITSGVQPQNLNGEVTGIVEQVLHEGKAITKDYKGRDVLGVFDDAGMIDVYVPVRHENAINGVLLLKIKAEMINKHIKAFIKTIIMTLTGGLMILYFLLINILLRTSKTLIKQNIELGRQKLEIEQSYKKLNKSYKSTVSVLSNAVDARDPYTAGHSERVTKISLLLGKELKLTDTELQDLEYAALFHDIGKIGIPDHILLKKGKLTDEEFEVIKRHPSIGVNILKEVDFVKDALPIIKHHHEKYGAKGYPDNLSGQDIPIGARIIAVADTYDAMTTDRPYRNGFSHEEAVEEILRNKGQQFDGEIVDAFLSVEQDVRDISLNEEEETIE